MRSTYSRGLAGGPKGQDNRREMMDSVKSSIDAAALQADMARRLNLPGSKASNTVGLRGGGSKRTPQRQSADEIICSSCRKTNPRNSSLCSSCGYFFPAIRPQQSMGISLAEARGLVKAPVRLDNPVMTPSDWEGVEKKLHGRNEAHCPICMEGFNQGREVLLSCSHMFHRACLESFEKFMKTDRSCPICRTSNYQKKITRFGSKAFEVVCAIKMQAIYRGFRTRKTFYNGLKNYYHSGNRGGALRKKFYERELTTYTDRISKDVEERRSAVDTMMSSVDQTLLESRELDALFDTIVRQRQELHFYSAAREISDGSTLHGDDDEILGDGRYQSYDYLGARDAVIAEGKLSRECEVQQLSELEWQGVLTKVRDRGSCECAICMGLNDFHGHRTLMVLSCSHLFHQQCVENFERFLVEEAHSCPVCRFVGYGKRILDWDDRKYTSGEKNRRLPTSQNTLL